jgi:hypothetical protein
MADVNQNDIDPMLYNFIAAKTPGKITPEVFKSFIMANKTSLNNFRYADWNEINGRLVGLDIDDSRKRYIISTSSTPPKDSYVKQSFVLKGVPPIPTLYGFIYEVQNTLEFPKELGHYLFLMPALSKMFGKDSYLSDFREPEKMNDFIRFVQEGKGKLDSIRRSFQHEPRPLGGGSDGFAYAIGKTRIFKIFQQQFSYDAARDAANKIWKQHGAAGTEAYIEDLGKIGNFGKHPVYYYIQERMETVFNFFNEDRRLMDQLKGFIKDIINNVQQDSNYESIRRNKNHPRIGNAIKSLTERVYNKMGYTINEELNSKLEGKLKPDWILKLIEEVIAKLITDRTDLRPYNTGITSNGYLRFFDPAFDPKEL